MAFLETLTINIQGFRCYHNDSQMRELDISNAALQKTPYKFPGSDEPLPALGTI